MKNNADDSMFSIDPSIILTSVAVGQSYGASEKTWIILENITNKCTRFDNHNNHNNTKHNIMVSMVYRWVDGGWGWKYGDNGGYGH